MLAIALCTALLFGAPAHAKAAFSPIPASQTGGKSTGLEMRVVDYNGTSNGTIEVEVKNPTSQALDFSAKGLYFVPDGDPDHAPQRVGAVGPFLVKNDKGWKREKQANLPANSTTRIKLDVYCIDSQRGSPSSSTSFHVGKALMPMSVAEAIDQDAAAAAAPVGGVAAPAAKSAVQMEVWKNRDKKWIKLDGEGKQEVGK